ncbi:MAG TPA: class I SAM-dependent methyltransferase [Coleofasciculaceae cyanobacterium]|jgi:SAM-dependent methyltransferase
MKTLGCRFCKAPLTHSFADLGMSPLSNSYIRPERVDGMEPFYPLHAYVCENCFLVQLGEFESPEYIFGDYAYFSSYSDSWLAHCKTYSQSMVRRFSLDEQSQVIELASNDGYLLQYFKEMDIPVLGVEPAANVAEVAIQAGIPMLVKFFGTRTADELTQEGHQADLLVANNVLAHVPDLCDFVQGIKQILKPTGVFTIEFPHLLQLIRQNQFDTIYHEHFSYFSFGTAQRIFAHFGMTLFDVDELSTHGGSLRIYGCHEENTTLPVSENVMALLDKEHCAGLNHLQAYDAFNEQVKATKRHFLKFLIEAKEQGKTIVGYGAPAKSTTLLNYCGVGTDFIDYTVDRNPHKQNCLLPGTRIPIYHPNKIQKTQPDYVVILPWNLREEVMAQMAYIQDWGGEFVLPFPQSREVDSQETFQKGIATV